MINKMVAYMKFNINSKVRVKLTAYGKKVHQLEHERFWRRFERIEIYVPPKEDENGWSEWQLWHLMETFGRYLTMGTEQVPFETDIELDIKEGK